MKQIIFLALVIVFGCKSTSISHTYSGRWLNTNAVNDNDYFLFDFDKGWVETIKMQRYKIHLSKDKISIDRLSNPTIISLTRGENGEMFMTDEFGSQVVLIKAKHFYSNNNDFEKNYFVSKLFKVVSNVPVDYNWAKQIHFFDFVTDTTMVVTSIDTLNFDTTSMASRWSLRSIDAVHLLVVNSIFHSRFFLTNSNDSSLDFRLLFNDSLYPVTFNRTSIRALNSEEIIHSVKGSWVVERCDDSLLQEIYFLEISDNEIHINKGMYSAKSGAWKMDTFGKLIITDLDDPFQDLFIQPLGEKIKIDVKGTGYLLRRRDED